MFWLLLIMILSFWSYLFGLRLAKQHSFVLLSALLLDWGLLLFFMLIRSYPEYECFLLDWDGYIYLRGGIYLPLVALFAGACIQYLQLRSRQAIKCLLLFLALIAFYDYRWGVGLVNYEKLRGNFNEYGICNNSFAETQGAAASASLVNYFGVPVTEGWMAKATLTRSNGGADILGLCYGIKSALEKSECRVRVRYLTWDELLCKKTPSLVFMSWNVPFWQSISGSQACVFYGADAKGVLLGSPRRGLTWMLRHEFERLWNHRAIVIDYPDYLRPGHNKIVWI